MRDEIRFFMCLISLVVAVPVNHFSAELRKGRRLRSSFLMVVWVFRQMMAASGVCL